MKQFIALLILSLGLLGCQDVKQPEKPENLIGTDKMVDILTEAYLANAARSVDNRSIISKGVKMDSLIYKNFGVDSLQFAKSNAFYASDVNTYMDILKKIEIRLTAMQKRMDSIQDLKEATKDSTDARLLKRKKFAEIEKDSLI
ncbi:DUF4296 domain-containing protein [Aequorivita sp. Q41]|uniref:DUF4296 domain-containing protein n=1 Tax=Aequorivita sp. Q41 TaxID=3153300 RepID=UPI003242C5CD